MQLGATLETSSLGRRTRSLQVVGSSIFWITEDLSPVEQSKIVAWEAPAAARVLLKPSATGRHFQLLRAGPEWMAWIEHGDAPAFSDHRIYAARRSEMRPILIDDMARYQKLATHPEVALDGSDLYWTVPEVNGDAWRGRLLHRNLEEEGVEALEAEEGAIMSGPSAARGVLAYEVVRQQRDAAYSVRYRMDGRTFQIDGPVSEPTVGDGYVLLKKGDRYSLGTMGATRFGSTVLIDLGAGESPFASGALAVWSNSGALGAAVAKPLDACVAPFLSDRMTNNASESSPAVGGSRLAWVYVSQSGAVVREFVRASVMERLDC